MAGFDAHKNLAVSAVVTAPSPATSGTSLTVTAGEGARFPVPPFNATVWPVNALPTPLTGEVIRVTARATDTLTITRAQEGSTARTIGTGDLIAATITAKTLTDLETRAALKDELNTFTQHQQIATGQPRVILTDTLEPANAQRFDLLAASSRWTVQALADNGALQDAPLAVSRPGDAFVSRDVYEKGRLTAVGHWIDVPFNAANFTAGGATWTVTAGNHTAFAYALVGKTLHIALYLTATTLSAPASTVHVALPGGFTIRNSMGLVAYKNPGAGVGVLFLTLNQSSLTFYRDLAGAAWSAGALDLSGQFTIGVQ